jgi:alpha-1,6-mannosyltransferase
MNLTLSAFNKKNNLLFLLSGALYVFLVYFVERNDSYILLPVYVGLFLLYILIYKNCNTHEVTYWLAASFLLRLMLLFGVPNLSDDFYRFIWDGRLLQEGVHPFSEVPSYYMQANHNIAGLDAALFEKLNSKEYFTIYPPIAQAIFWLSVVVSPNSVTGGVLTLKILVLMAEVGSLYFLVKLLQQFKLPLKNVLLYALNPLVVLEITGNLHFEAFLVLFLIASIYYITKERYKTSAILFGFAICVKLIPLIFLPVLLPAFGWRKAFMFYAIVTITCIVLFVPLLTGEIISGFHESIGYYFQKFEFNASIYYLVREWGFWKYGYNIVQTVGWKLGLASGLLILTYSWRNLRSTYSSASHLLFREWLIILFIYLIFTTTVHPWYCIPLIAFCIFTNYRFPIVWSLLIFFTYIGYSATGYVENLWVVSVEYLIVIVILIVEVWKRKSLALLYS